MQPRTEPMSHFAATIMATAASAVTTVLFVTIGWFLHDGGHPESMYGIIILAAPFLVWPPSLIIWLIPLHLRVVRNSRLVAACVLIAGLLILPWVPWGISELLSD